MKTWALCSSTLVAVLQLPACLVVAEGGEPPRGVGTLTLDWTIDGQRDARDCVDFGAVRLEIAIFDRFDRFVDTVEPRCEWFGTSVDLPEDQYFLELTLIDRFDRSVTDTLVPSAIDIIEGTELVLSEDFPLESFR